MSQSHGIGDRYSSNGLDRLEWQLNQMREGGGANGGGANSSTSVTAGIDASADIDAILAAIGTDTDAATAATLLGRLLRIATAVEQQTEPPLIEYQTTAGGDDWFVGYVDRDPTTGDIAVRNFAGDAVTATKVRIGGTTPPIVGEHVAQGESLSRRFFTRVDDNFGYLSALEVDAVERTFLDLADADLLSAIRYLNLFVGDSSIAYKTAAIGGVARLDGSPIVQHSRQSGVTISGGNGNTLNTLFIPSASGLSIRNHYKAAYILQSPTTGVVYGGGTQYGDGYSGPYVGFASGFSRIAGASLTYQAAQLGLQAVTANPTNVISYDRYRQLQSVANPLVSGDEATAPSLVLNHWNNATNFASDARVGAVVEATALTAKQSGNLSGILDRYHFMIGRRAALDAVFFGDSITFGVGITPAGSGARYSSQVCAALNLTEDNQGVSGMALQSGSFDGTVAPGVNEYVNRIINRAPAYVFILIGTNDIIRAADYVLTGYRPALETLLQTCIDAGIYHKNIFVGTVPYASDAAFVTYPSGSRAKIESYVQAIKEVGAAKKVNVVDVYAAMRDNGGAALLPDNIHPNEVGARVIANAFVQAFYRSHGG